VATTVTLGKVKQWFRGEAIEKGSLVKWVQHPQQPLGIVLTSERKMQTAQVFWVQGNDLMMPLVTSWIRKRELSRVEENK
jgi:hypothetical protein